ncbi:hypothetical protein B0T14DRAFT_147104, partial [Immersiella caudata]
PPQLATPSSPTLSATPPPRRPYIGPRILRHQHQIAAKHKSKKLATEPLGSPYPTVTLKRWLIFSRTSSTPRLPRPPRPRPAMPISTSSAAPAPPPTAAASRSRRATLARPPPSALPPAQRRPPSASLRPQPPPQSALPPLQPPPQLSRQLPSSSVPSAASPSRRWPVDVLPTCRKRYVIHFSLFLPKSSRTKLTGTDDKSQAAESPIRNAHQDKAYVGERLWRLGGKLPIKGTVT